MKNITLDGVEYTPVIKEKHKRITQTLDFEVYPYNLDKMSWDKALISCAKLGKGWRLPTRLELILMYETQVCDFNDMNYWSSMEFDNNYAWLQSFNNGVQNYGNKDFAFYVHSVRDIKPTLASGGGDTSTGVLNTQLLTGGASSIDFTNTLNNIDRFYSTNR